MMVVNLIEHDDGSATVQLDMSPEEVHALIESAFRIALVKGLKMVEEQDMKEWEDERQEAKPDNWVELTHEEVNSWELPDFPTVFEFAKFIESKLKEKNT